MGIKKFCLIVVSGVFFMVFIGLTVRGGSYELSAGMGLLVTEKADNLWVKGHRKIDSIYDKPKSKTNFMLFPSIDLRYPGKDRGISPGVDLYLNTILEPGSVNLGMKTRFDRSFIDIYGFYSFTAGNWQNPYVLYRRSTKTGYYGGKITYGNIFNSNFSLSYRGALTNVEKDTIGRFYRDLRQDGNTHTVNLMYSAKLSDSLRLLPDVSFEKGVFDGRSNSYDSLEGGLGFEMRMADFVVTGARIYGKRAEFDKTHPIYSEKRDDNTYGANAFAAFTSPFGLKGYVLTAGLGVSRTNSNITFFDRKGFISFLTMAYRF